jgi:hypothetical protein
MAHGLDPRYFDIKPVKIKPSLWPAKPSGMPDGHYYLCNTEFNGRKICWGTVIERK